MFFCLVIIVLAISLSALVSTEQIQEVQTATRVLDQIQRLHQNRGPVQQPRLPARRPAAAGVLVSSHCYIVLPCLLAAPDESACRVAAPHWGTSWRRPCWEGALRRWRSWAGRRWSDRLPTRGCLTARRSCGLASLGAASPKDSTQTGREGRQQSAGFTAKLDLVLDRLVETLIKGWYFIFYSCG